MFREPSAAGEGAEIMKAGASFLTSLDGIVHGSSPIVRAAEAASSVSRIDDKH